MGSESEGERQTGSVDDMRVSKSSMEPILSISNLNSALSNVPYIASMNVNKSSGVHIGPKNISITHNIQNTEGMKGRLLGLELLSAKSGKRLRCSVAIFVCWALVVASTLLFCLFYFAIGHHVRLDIGLNATWYLRRADWQALPPYKVEYRALPVKNVIIGHTATSYCNEKYSCIKKVLQIQNDHLKRRFHDIGPNYLVGGNGFVFEGRGSNVLGLMVANWNKISISIMFIGNYCTDYPDQKQFEHVNKLLEVLVAENILDPEYVVYGHCQLSTYIVTPGPHIRDNLQNITHWRDDNVDKCLDQ